MADQRILKHHQASKGRRKIPIAAIGDKNKKHVTFSKRRLGLFKKASELCVLCGADLAIITFSEVGKVFCFGHPTAESVIQRYTGGGGGGGTSCRLIPSSSSSSSSSISLAASPATTPSHLPPAPAVLMLLDQHQAPQPDCNIIKINNQIRSMKDDQAGTAAAGIVMNKYIEDYERVKKRIEQEKKNSPSSYADYNINSTTPPASCSSNEFWWEEPVDELDLPELEQLMASLQDLRNNVARKAEELSMHVLIREHVGHINDIADHPRQLHHRIINSGIMVDQSTAPVQDPLANFDMFNSESGFGGSGFTFA